MGSVTDQSGRRFRCEWGAEGITALTDCAALVIADVLSFSTSTTIAVSNGARVLPMRVSDEAAVATARARGAVMAGDQREGDERVASTHSWTLRPSSLVDIEPGVLLGLPSPNGATLCGVAAQASARVFVGCPRNAAAVGRSAVRSG